MRIRQQEVEQAIEDLDRAAADYAAAKQREMALEDERPLVKSEAISRIMALPDPQKDGKLYSATAAEAIVVSDKAFALHRQDQGLAAAATIVAEGRYQTAKRELDFELELFRLANRAVAQVG